MQMTPRNLAARTHRTASGCLEWTAARSKAGYGQFRRDGATAYVHRAVWEQANGPIPPRMSICHRCDNPACCELSHLFIGSHYENMQDMARKGRSPGQIGDASPKAKLTRQQVEECRRRRANGEQVKRIAESVGLNPGAMSRVLRGLRHGYEA